VRIATPVQQPSNRPRVPEVGTGSKLIASMYVIEYMLQKKLVAIAIEVLLCAHCHYSATTQQQAACAWGRQISRVGQNCTFIGICVVHTVF
jgi:hypothetical protein